MRKISTRIKRILTSNLGLKIVSVLVACMMWIFVVNVDDPEKVQSFSDVKVEIRNSDCFGVDKTFSVQEDTDKVKVWVKARESVLNKLQSKDFKVVADMRNVTLGNAVPYTLECTSSALTKANWECEPASLKIRLKMLCRNRSVWKWIRPGSRSMDMTSGLLRSKRAIRSILRGRSR